MLIDKGLLKPFIIPPSNKMIINQQKDFSYQSPSLWQCTSTLPLFITFLLKYKILCVFC